MNLPIICLVGRTNVGKSAIFNRFTKRKVKNLVLDQEHVTRDYIEDIIVESKTGKSYLLVDTGGISIAKLNDPMLEEVRVKALDMVKKATLILFVCDAQVGLMDQDIQLVKFIRQFGRPMFLLINKVDNDQIENETGQFERLGLKMTFPISAIHNHGFDLLKKEVLKLLPAPEVAAAEQEDENEFKGFKIAIIGKPNVGKSSLLNMLLGKQRSIVSDVAGTTREAIRANGMINQQSVELIDTAGVRRQRSVNETLEQMMVKSSFEALKGSQVIIMMIDGSSASLCHQDLKLLEYAREQKKAVILVINKADLITEDRMKFLEMDFERYDFIFKHVPVVKISCLSSEGLGKLRNHLDDLWERRNTRFNTTEVTNLIKTYLEKRPLYKRQTLLKVYKVRAIEAKRIPTFHVFVADATLWQDQELNCIENVIRKNYNLRGCPVVVQVRTIS